MPNDLSLFYLTLHEWLMPWEDIILRLQSLVLWQNPLKSLIFTLIVHGCYWYLVWWPHNSLVVLAAILLAIHVIDFWRNYFWPLITDCSHVAPLRFLPFIKWQQKTRRSVMWDTKGGRHLLTVHEICTHIHTFVLRARHVTAKIYHFRVDHRFLFFLISSTMCLFTAYLGLYIYARTVFYAFLTSILLIPSASYHQLHSKLHNLISPWLARLDAELTARVQFECPKQAEAEELAFQPSLKDWKKAIEKEIIAAAHDDINNSHEDDLFIEENFNLRPTTLLDVEDYSSHSNSAPIRDEKRLSLLDSALTDEDDDDEWDLDQATSSGQASPVLRHWDHHSAPIKHVLTSSDCLLDDDNGFEIIDCP